MHGERTLAQGVPSPKILLLKPRVGSRRQAPTVLEGDRVVRISWHHEEEERGGGQCAQNDATGRVEKPTLTSRHSSRRFVLMAPRHRKVNRHTIRSSDSSSI